MRDTITLSRGTGQPPALTMKDGLGIGQLGRLIESEVSPG